ncbi:fructosamine kinase family protein [Corynebacterium sp. MSK019]|uniref:fructosamine kinase family protein n=1 Tax=Corynebacterium sp. MSK019 TaxID=3050190 RepID=UPI00254AAF2A|nr:fructosamine kinase family protein [Corynebacterium sp. MSK019]MDK8849389.1 fructosamine kinase family protein [Corynebacterium sp. MSK019]
MSAMNQNYERAVNESDVYVKSRHGVPRGFFACEAAGLDWLREGESDGGARVVDVLGVSGHALKLRRIESMAPNPQAAYEFGKSLAITHNLGAAGWGAGPDEWEGHGYFGPLDQPLQMDLTPRESFGEYWAKGRLLPTLGKLENSYNNRQLDIFDQLIDRLLAGDFDNEPDAARVHGDLWWGNLMWDADGAILIDPAAHGGAREEDLALLALFGATHFNEILRGYESVHPLPDFAESCELHQLYAVLMHAVLFGGGYAGQAAAMAAKYVR